MMNIGEKVTVNGTEWHSGPLTGHVCWVHPQRRFFVVEFDAPGGTIREAVPDPARLTARAAAEELEWAAPKKLPGGYNKVNHRLAAQLYKDGYTDTEISARIGARTDAVQAWRRKMGWQPHIKSSAMTRLRAVARQCNAKRMSYGAYQVQAVCGISTDPAARLVAVRGKKRVKNKN